jgi:hypothetical protein
MYCGSLLSIVGLGALLFNVTLALGYDDGRVSIIGFHIL